MTSKSSRAQGGEAETLPPTPASLPPPRARLGHDRRWCLSGSPRAYLLAEVGDMCVAVEGQYLAQVDDLVAERGRLLELQVARRLFHAPLEFQDRPRDLVLGQLAH